MLMLRVIGHLGIELLGWSLLIGRAGWFTLPQVVAALILLPHAVHQEEDQENGEQKADHTAGYNGYRNKREERKTVKIQHTKTCNNEESTHITNTL